MTNHICLVVALVAGCAPALPEDEVEVAFALGLDEEAPAPPRLGDTWRSPMGYEDQNVCTHWKIGGSWSGASGGRCWTRGAGLCYMPGILPSSCKQYGGVYGTATRCWWPASSAPGGTTCVGTDASSPGWYDDSPTCMAGDVAAAACGMVGGSYTYDPACPQSEPMSCTYPPGHRLAKKFASLYSEGGNCISQSVQGRWSGSSLVCWTRDYRGAFTTMDSSEGTTCGALDGNWHAPTQHCWHATP